MESKVEEAVLAGNNKSISFPADAEEKDAAMASLSAPAAISAFLAPPLSLLHHFARACASYPGLDGRKPPAPSSSAAAAQQDEVETASEDCRVVVVQVRSRGISAPSQPRSVPVGSRIGERGGAIH